MLNAYSILLLTLIFISKFLYAENVNEIESEVLSCNWYHNSYYNLTKSTTNKHYEGEVDDYFSKNFFTVDLESLYKYSGVKLIYVKETNVFSDYWRFLKAPSKSLRWLSALNVLENWTDKLNNNVSSTMQMTPFEFLKYAQNHFNELSKFPLNQIEKLPSQFIIKNAYTKDDLKNKLKMKRKLDESYSGYDKYVKFKDQFNIYTCLKLTPHKLKKCIDASNYIIENLFQKGNSYNLGSVWLEDVLTNEYYYRGAFRLLSKIIKRIIDNDYESANIVADAYIAFKDNLMPEAITRKMAEDFLFLSFIHGQIGIYSYNTFNYIQKYNHITISAAHTLSIIIPLMDLLVKSGSSTQHGYIMPSNVGAFCDNGKQYHYIIPWYIAKKLRNEGYSEEISFKVSMLAEWSYLSFSHSVGRLPFSNLYLHANHYNNISNRWDFLHAGFGAFQGTYENSNIKLKKSCNMEEVFKRISYKIPVSYLVKQPRLVTPTVLVPYFPPGLPETLISFYNLQRLYDVSWNRLSISNSFNIITDLCSKSNFNLK